MPPRWYNGNYLNSLPQRSINLNNCPQAKNIFTKANECREDITVPEWNLEIRCTKEDEKECETLPCHPSLSLCTTVQKEVTFHVG
jgi:hypothetical protein